MVKTTDVNNYDIGYMAGKAHNIINMTIYRKCSVMGS